MNFYYNPSKTKICLSYVLLFFCPYYLKNISFCPYYLKKISFCPYYLKKMLKQNTFRKLSL